jgi:FdhE protein
MGKAFPDCSSRTPAVRIQRARFRLGRDFQPLFGLIVIPMKDFWEKLIRRSAVLSAEHPAVAELLTFYGKVLMAQKEIYDRMTRMASWLPSGELEQDLETIRPLMRVLLETARSHGPELLATEAEALSASCDAEIDELLLAYWINPSGTLFFAKAFLQPYAHWLAEVEGGNSNAALDGIENRCPSCGGKPQLSFLISKEQEGGVRMLLCAVCLSEWTFRRVVCAACGEERPGKLATFKSPDLEHLRVEACDTCRMYIKGVDKTILGTAAPLVDEVAGSPLDVWAKEQGYEKIELNLVGL